MSSIVFKNSSGEVIFDENHSSKKTTPKTRTRTITKRKKNKFPIFEEMIAYTTDTMWINELSKWYEGTLKNNFKYNPDTMTLSYHKIKCTDVVRISFKDMTVEEAFHALKNFAKTHVRIVSNADKRENERNEEERSKLVDNKEKKINSVLNNPVSCYNEIIRYTNEVLGEVSPEVFTSYTDCVKFLVKTKSLKSITLDVTKQHIEEINNIFLGDDGLYHCEVADVKLTDNIKTATGNFSNNVDNTDINTININNLVPKYKNELSKFNTKIQNMIKEGYVAKSATTYVRNNDIIEKEREIGENTPIQFASDEW